MAEPALETLLDIVRDPASGLRNRLSAAVAASRVSTLAMPGEQPPEAVMYLREIVGTEHEGSRFRVEFRREAATALSYYERRCKKAELQYVVPDQDEQKRQWRAVINGCLRIHLEKRGLSRRKDVLIGTDDQIAMPAAIDPEVALSAVLLGGNRHERRRRQKAIDERVTGTWSGTEAERQEILRAIGQVMHHRLLQFGLAR